MNLAPYSGFTPGTLVLPTLPLPGRGTPPRNDDRGNQENIIKRVTEMELKRCLGDSALVDEPKI